MATLGEEMNTRKVIVDASTDGTTYIGVARYPRPFETNDYGYKSASDTAANMWKIRKIVDDNGITTIYYPNGDWNASYSWDCRTTYCYV